MEKVINLHLVMSSLYLSSKTYEPPPKKPVLTCKESQLSPLHGLLSPFHTYLYLHLVISF